MSQIKKKDSKIKINPNAAISKQGCSSDQHPCFSFRYMTKNKRYSLEFLESCPGREREKTLALLYNRLEELSHRPWRYWMQNPRKNGVETLCYDRFYFTPNNDANLTGDSTIYVFRFDTYKGSGKGRIIGFKKSPCSVLNIIGYDFDHSAYDH